MNDLPKSGDEFVCEVCNMALEITVDCGCDDTKCVSFMCCEKEMVKVEP